ncbi:MAG: IS4 family transposase [Colwellia sp.]|nr:IS4 family transposase [Colwellia sp.]
MKLTALTEKVQDIFNSQRLFATARETQLVKRARQLKPLELLLAFIETLGCQSKANIADIHRKYQAISAMPIKYKPFHNQIKKSQCTDFFKNCFENALQTWVVQSLKLTSLSSGKHFPFEKVVLHDGCSFAIHSGLRDTFPGRFTKHTPAAVELHVTMDLMTSSIDYFALTADTISERHHSPLPEKLNNTLTLEDAGYFDRKRMMEIEQNGGYFIGQSACSINPIIKQAYDYDGNEIPKWHGKKLKQLKLVDKNATMDLTVRWPGYDMDFRVIAFWYKKKKRIGYLVTNLPRDTVPATDIVRLYRLRWQIELLFKELKSYCNLKKFSTENKHIVKTLIYASFITVLLKRLLAFSTEQLKSLWISTQKTARAASDWLKLLVNGIVRGEPITDVLREIVDIIGRLCQRAHPKRDLKHGLYQFGVLPVADIYSID